MVIVIRKDLNMRKGKMCAQAAHACQYAILDVIWSRSIPGGVWEQWEKNNWTKVVVSVDSEKELLEIHKKAKEMGLTSVLVTDIGKTEFKEPTNTAVAIGPGDAEAIDKITGKLSLL